MNKALLFALLACCYADGFATPSDTQLPDKRSPLTSISAVENLDAPPDPDDPGAGGGFDAETYFQNFVLAEVHTCPRVVLNEFIVWSKAQSLSITKTIQEPTSLLAFAALSAPAGVLELVYKFNTTQKRSRATLYFYSGDGSKHEPVAIVELLKRYDVAALQDKLRTAIACR